MLSKNTSQYLMNFSTNENEFVRHEPCPECTSSDAFAIYSDGGGYCFSCGHHSKGDGQPVPASTTSKPMINYSGDFAEIRSRNIREKTCKKFNVRVDAGPVIRFPYYSDGKLIAYKERDKSKNFRFYLTN